MIEDADREGVIDFLNYLPHDVVFFLADVITKKLIKFESIDEAISGICFYATSVSDLLHRQKLHKSMIFDYLYRKGVHVDPNANKGIFVERFIEFWKLEKQTKQISLPSNTNTSLDVNTSTEKMGEFFSNWFYEILNNVHPLYKQLKPSQCSDVFSPSHFLPDCELHITEYNQDGTITSKSSYSSANDCFQYLFNLVRNREVFFQPNVQSGVMVKQDVHGLIQIFVAGTVYHTNIHVGVFEQVFGLVRDMIRTDLWKIKFSKINIRHNLTNLTPEPVQSVCA